MTFNICKICGAGDGRAGNLVDGECANCRDTRAFGAVCVHTHLPRTDEEYARTFATLAETPGSGHTATP